MLNKNIIHIRILLSIAIATSFCAPLAFASISPNIRSYFSQAQFLCNAGIITDCEKDIRIDDVTKETYLPMSTVLRTGPSRVLVLANASSPKTNTQVSVPTFSFTKNTDTIQENISNNISVATKNNLNNPSSLNDLDSSNIKYSNANNNLYQSSVNWFGQPGPQGPAGANGVNTITYATGTVDALTGEITDFLFDNATGTNIVATGSARFATTTFTAGIDGAGLSTCNSLFDKLVYNSITKMFECAIDNTGAGGTFATATISTATVTNLIANNFKLIGGLRDSFGFLGTSGQVLTTNGTSTFWDTIVASASSSVSGVITATGTASQILNTGSSTSTVFALAASGVSASTYGSSTTIPVITVDAFGRITVAQSTTTSFLTSAPVTTVFGRSGAVTAQLADYNTSLVTENGNLYFTDLRVRSAPLTGFTLASSSITASDSVLTAFGKTQDQINLRENILSFGNGLNRVGNTITNSGVITATGTASQILNTGSSTSTVFALAASGVSASTYGSSTTIPVITVDAFGRITVAQSTTTSFLTSAPVTTVFGRSGAVTAQLADYNTSLVTENGNLYFTDLRVRSAPLTGFTLASSSITASDSVLTAFGKTQDQINLRENILSFGNGLNRVGNTITNSGVITATGTASQILNTGSSTSTVFALAASGVSASTYGSSTTIPVITVDAFGRITVAQSTSTGFLTTIPTNASSTNLTLGVGSSAAGRLYFANASNNFTTQLRSSSTQTSNIIFTLPNATGTPGQSLLTDGAGGLYFGSISGGSISGGVNGYLARWTSSSTLSTGLFLDDGTYSGINSTSTNYTFNVKGSSGVNPFNVASSSGSSLLSVQQNGNVGIGTTSSTSTLAVVGTLSVTATSTLVSTSITKLNIIGQLRDSLNATGTTGQVLTSNGTSTYWSTISGGGTTLNYYKESAAPVADSPIASGIGSIAIGDGAVANNLYSLSIGYLATSTGTSSSAIGSGNEAHGESSLAFGYYNVVDGDFSSAFGWINNSNGDSASAFGYTNSAFANNASAFGSYNNSNGDSASAFGISNNANGDFSSAFGKNNTANGPGSVAMGYANTSAADRTIAIGYLNYVSSDLSMAFGNSNIVDSTDSSVFGSNITNSVASSTMIGPNDYAKITILANGNVGIGTISPNSTLSVVGSSSVTGTSTLATTSITSLSVAGTTTLGLASGKDGILSFQNAVNNFVTSLKSSSTAASNLTFTLPGTNGVGGQTLTSDGNGGMYWSTIAGGAGSGVSLAPVSADIVNSSNSGIKISQTGSGNLLQLQKSGIDKFIVANTGGLTINGADSSIVKTTSADFSLGTVGSGITNSNNRLELSDGVIPNSGLGTVTTASQATTSGSIGAGALAITRADGMYLILRGGATNAMNIYDSVAGTTTVSAQVTSAVVGTGALAIPRPDGRYLVVHGGTLTTSSLVDPQGIVAVVAGPTVVASGAGTLAFKRLDGKFLKTNGGAGSTSIYDTVANTFATGPSFTTGIAAAGALVLPRLDGQALIVVGGATGNTQLYNQSSAAGNIGVFSAGPVLGTGCEINGAGSVAFRRQDGKYVVLSKATSSTVYDPIANTFTCSTTNGPGVALGDGAHAIPLQNGNFLIIVGGGSTTSFIYNSSDDTYTYHNTAMSAVSTGAFSLMKHDGTWQVFVGNGANTNNYDTGLPMTGVATSYTSEDISSTALNARSILKWTAQFETPYIGRNATTNSAYSTLQFIVRTATSTAALSYASEREILSSGDLLRASSTDQALRIKVQFNRPIPKRISDERGTWTGNGSTVTRLDYATPTVFDIAIDNSTALHRTLADFAEPNAALSDTQNETSGPIMTRVEATVAGLQLPYGRITPTTGAGTTQYYLGLWSGAHPNIPQAQTNEGTIVIARPNKTFLIIASLTAPAANASLYDPATQSFISQSGSNIPTAANSIGGFALKRPDGKFLVVMGSSTAVTNIYDADTNTFSVGPSLSGNVSLGASAIANSDGTFTIVHGGGLLTSTLYDPVRNTMIAGPVLTTAANCGFFAIPLQNGMYKTFVGVATGTVGISTSMNYNPISKTFVAGTSFTSVHGCGAFAFQRQDGYWLTVSAGSGATGTASIITNLVNPIDGTTILGPGLLSLANRGTHVIPRADGTFLIVSASSTTGTSIYIPTGGTFGIGAGIGSMVAGPTLATAAGPGAVSFQRPDGKWVLLNGSSTATTNLYDAGWYAEGQYLSEQMQVPALAANSTLEWKQSPDNFVRMEVRASSSQAALSNIGYSTIGRSGESINNVGGETWVQVVVNFRRDFPTFGGTLSGVYNTGGGMVYPYRNISLPTVTEYKINNGMDLMTLQDNGLNVLRVTTAGNVYTGANGGFYSGGADLAERYASTDYLEPGDLVISDYQNNHGVKKSTGQYQEGLLGVVSTDPGFVAGAFTEDSYPIALVGRVPVKVSTENGVIHAGDYLTSASIPGYAMKATFAGRVVGKAMEDLTDANMKTCPGVALGLNEKTKCGTIMMFVSLVDYKGGSIELAMKEWNEANATSSILADYNGLSLNDINNTGVSSLGYDMPITNSFNTSATTHDKDVLNFLENLKKERESTLNGQSDVFANNIHVISEIIAPKIVSDILIAREAHITSIEGFSIITDTITAKKVITDSLVSSDGNLGFRFTEDGKLVMFGKSTSTSTTTATSTLEDGTSTSTELTISTTTEKEVISFDTFGNAFFAGQIIAKEVKTDSLEVTGSTILSGGLVVNTIGTDSSILSLMGDVNFFGTPYFTRDMGGTAIIKKDAKEVEIIFDKEYIEAPSVVASFSFADEATSTLVEKQNAVFDNDLKFIVTKRTTKGFTILLNKSPSQDITFMWMALAIRDSKTFTSRDQSKIENVETNINTEFTSTSTIAEVGTSTVEITSTTTENILSTTTEILPVVSEVEEISVEDDTTQEVKVVDGKNNTEAESVITP